MITEDVGNRIRYLRKQRGISQEKLALIAGIESGKRNATIISLEKIINALGVSMKDFFDY